MPNWCENQMWVQGKKEKVDKFDEDFHSKPGIWPISQTAKMTSGSSLEQLVKDKLEERRNAEEKRCFYALYPQPVGVIMNGYSPIGDRTRGPNCSGYSWNNAYWGTKWDVYGRVDTATSIDLPDKHYLYEFQTAWSPPLPWLDQLVLDYPEINFKLWYEERGAAFAGTVTYEGGDLISNKEYQPKHKVDYCEFAGELFA